MWLAEDEDTRIYLLGTMHALPQHIDWDGGKVAEAVAAAGELIMELSPDELAAAGEEFARLAPRPVPLPIEKRLTPAALAQYRALEAFALFASDLDATSRRQLERGARLTELLRQPQYSPFPVENQVVSIWAGTKGKLDTIPVEDVLRFEKELHDYLGRNTKVLDKLRETNVLDDETEAELEKAVDAFLLEFQPGEGGPGIGSEEFEAAEVEDVNQERIVKGKR